jgi:hypothetical protein
MILGLKSSLKKQATRKKLQSTPGMPPKLKGHNPDSLNHPNSYNHGLKQPMKQLKSSSKHC